MCIASRPLPAEAKCTRCRSRATIRLPSHHALFCPECFHLFFHRAILRAMEEFDLPGASPIMVAVSGGKDSLALWDALHELGYPVQGLHIDLGISGFSQASSEVVARFAATRGFSWTQVLLRDVFGYSVQEIHRRTRRKICSVCGLLKRQLLNRLVIREGYRILATGHNLDDEAGRLLGNLVRHRTHYLEKLSPFLPSRHPRLPVKIKPLYRLEASEIRIYCEIKGIQPLSTPCPLSRGATSHTFKEALQFLENKMPGTKREFLFGYLHKSSTANSSSEFGTCKGCGEPAYSDLCSVCSLKRQLEAKMGERT